MFLCQTSISDIYNSCPQFVWESLLVLLTTIVGGLLIGYFATAVLEKKNEITRVEGLLVEKKLEVYDEIHRRIQGFTNLMLIPNNTCGAVLKLLHETGIEIDTGKIDFNQIPIIFTDVDKLQESFLGLDDYIIQKRLYLDEEVAIATSIFQNYYCVYNRFWAMFKNQLVDAGVDADSKESRAVANKMFIGLAMMQKDEFYDQIEKVENAIRDGINNISMKRREVPNYDYAFYRDEDGVIMRNLSNTMLLKELDKITKFITTCTALALLAKMKR